MLQVVKECIRSHETELRGDAKTVPGRLKTRHVALTLSVLCTKESASPK